MNKVIKAQHDNLIRLAKDDNFWGKFKRESKLAVADKILGQLGLTQNDLTSADLVNWLEENRPIKQAKSADKKQPSNKLEANAMLGDAEKRIAAMGTITGSRFLITSAQNNTGTAAVFDKLEALANQIDAALIVMPVYYNKAAFSAAVEDEKAYFDAKVKPYLIEDDVWLGFEYGVRLMASAHVLPTVKLPVNKAEQLGVGELATVLASPKQQMKTRPRLPNQPISQAWTTGSCTKYNYLQSGAGVDAEKAHVFGALLVEIKGDFINITNIREGVDGSLSLFIDNNVFNDDGVNLYNVAATPNLLANRPCLVLGDLHCEMQDVHAFDTTCHMISNLIDIGQKPVVIAVHDILHFETRSHHNRKSGKHLYKMHINGASVLDDLGQVIDQLNELAELTDMVYIVESNHNSALDNWLDDSSYSPKHDPENSKLYYLLNYFICEALDSGIDKTALEVAFKDAISMLDLPPMADNIVFGSMAQSFTQYGIELSQHGHKGQNGSHGGAALFNRWLVPMCSGHTHSPMILDFCFVVGVMAKLDQGYNRGGASSWDQANMIIHPNGAVQLLKVQALTRS
ncbi:putative A1 protein [Vibrio phage JSF12]|uniref:Putative A1 protein n=2 Tax=Jesfedecavirus TaxID=2560156 RepID=A0A2D0YXL1_9CAUD|nr:DNA transfer protein [Vibrio phage JSF10]YP_009794780.1 DNA transfer protein [Vibrio phage JSF12]ASV43484.1 putative A1 protein [Vibrio phage JSF10]ASV43615.1 putative A1 protein [Vibrio phage JSF12]